MIHPGEIHTNPGCRNAPAVSHVMGFFTCGTRGAQTSSSHFAALHYRYWNTTLDILYLSAGLTASLSPQRSISFRNESQMERAAHPPPSSSTTKTRVISATVSNPSSSMTATRVSTATAPAAKRRDSKLWSETFDVRLGATQPLSPKEIKRQEVRDTLVLDWRISPCFSSRWCLGLHHLLRKYNIYSQ